MYQEYGTIYTEYTEYHPRHLYINIQESNSGYIYEVIVAKNYLSSPYLWLQQLLGTTSCPA
jgi:hypothetical protein